MYCRFCTRKRATMARGGWDAVSRDDERMIEYVREAPGDPRRHRLRRRPAHAADRQAPVLPRQPGGDRRTSTSSASARACRSRCRSGSTTSELIDLLASAEKVWIQTHFNHPREITPEAARVCKALLRAGHAGQQPHRAAARASTTTWRRCATCCAACCGSRSGRTTCSTATRSSGPATSARRVWKGLEIMEGLRGHMSGLGIPTYVVDSPHGGGKIPLMPNYLVSRRDDAVVLRNYEGMLVRYQAEDKPDDGRADGHPRRQRAACRGRGRSSCPKGASGWPGGPCKFSTTSRRQTAPARMGQSPTKRLRSKSRFRPARGVPQPGGERAHREILGWPSRQDLTALAPSPKRRGGTRQRQDVRHRQPRPLPLTPSPKRRGGTERVTDEDRHRLRPEAARHLSRSGHPTTCTKSSTVPPPCEAIADAIRELGHTPVELGNGRDLLQKLLTDPPDLVFNFAEGTGTSRNREARVPAVCEMLGIPYTGSDVLTLALSLDKDMCRRVVQDADVRVPNGILVTFANGEYDGDYAEFPGMVTEIGLSVPLIAKPVCEGSSKGIRRSA